MDRSRGGLLIHAKAGGAEEEKAPVSIRRRVFIPLCVACHDPGGIKGRSPIRAFDRPFKGTVHQRCLVQHKGYIITVRSRKGSKTRILMGGLIDHLMGAVRPAGEGT